MKPNPGAFRIHGQESEVKNAGYASVALVHFLFAIFCAYWAQTTDRNPWLWFFLGFFFAPITGLVLLGKNREDKAREK